LDGRCCPLLLPPYVVSGPLDRKICSFPLFSSEFSIYSGVTEPLIPGFARPAQSLVCVLTVPRPYPFFPFHFSRLLPPLSLKNFLCLTKKTILLPNLRLVEPPPPRVIWFSWWDSTSWVPDCIFTPLNIFGRNSFFQQKGSAPRPVLQGSACPFSPAPTHSPSSNFGKPLFLFPPPNGQVRSPPVDPLFFWLEEPPTSPFVLGPFDPSIPSH